MAEPTKLLIIEESTLVSLAGNPTIVKEFPFLSGLNSTPAVAKSSCGRCNQQASRRVSAVNGVKQSLIALGAEKKQQLKKLLNAEKVKIRVANNGRITEYTF